MTASVPVRNVRLAVATAVAGTVLIAGGAFWLSFTALADLARRSGIEGGQAWAWPLIVDGIIVVSTVAVVALAGHREAWYPWMLLIVGAGVSVTANSLHAIVEADEQVAAGLAAAVAAVPPLVLLAITHLTVLLARHRARETVPSDAPRGRDLRLSLPAPPLPGVSDRALRPPTRAARTSVRPSAPAALGVSVPREESKRVVAARFRAAGWSNTRIARELDVHPSTVGRWFSRPPSEPVTDAVSVRASQSPERDEEHPV